MANAPITDERLKEIVEICKANKRSEACTILGLSESTVRGHLREAARRGLSGFSPVLDGFEVAKVSSTVDAKTGEVTKNYISQKLERGPEFEAPPGFVLKGVTADVGPDGRINRQWPRYAPGADAAANGIEAIKAIFDQYKGRAELAPPPEHADSDFATAYIIGDHHLGLYCWAKETGSDYDVDIGERLLRGAMNDLVASAFPAETGIILSLGDFFHTDGSENRTPASGHALDVDSRRTRVAQIGLKLMIDCIELALQKHNHVIVRCLPGNHDPETTPWLSLALWAFFHSNPRVSVDCSPSRFWFWQFGKVMLAATHGDKCKPNELPNVMARDKAKMWGETKFRYGLCGHVHHKEKIGKEIGGAVVESFQVLPAADSWHVGEGYGAGRSMCSIAYHREYGERFRQIVSVQQLEAANG